MNSQTVVVFAAVFSFGVASGDHGGVVVVVVLAIF